VSWLFHRFSILRDFLTFSSPVSNAYAYEIGLGRSVSTSERTFYTIKRIGEKQPSRSLGTTDKTEAFRKLLFQLDVRPAQADFRVTLS